MSALVQMIDGSVIFGNPPLLDQASFTIQEGERLCILGRNGSGKSTLMKVLAGEIKLDDGQLLSSRELVVARLSQDPPQRTDVSVFAYVADGLKEHASILTDYYQVTLEIAEDPSEKNLSKLQRLQDELENKNAWLLEQRIQQLLTDFQLDGNASLASLSGGWRRKAALAQAMVQSPDILLLDEPTNHLDIDTVKWLENTVLAFNGTVVFISHDRAFIRRLSTRILDIDRGKVKSYEFPYDEYLVKKAQDLETESQQNKLFDKKLAEEEVWIRQGIKARRTRNEGRVRALKALREEYKARRQVTGKATLSGNDGERSGKRIFECESVKFTLGDKAIAKDLNLLISRGDKVAFIGPNGCGKTSLIKLLLGEFTPDSGQIKTGTNLQVAYFDQHRQQLDLEKSVIDTVADGKRDLVVNGHPRHVMSYLQDYLFTPERANVPVKALSGGEKNRLMLAKIMLKPHNLLILDEPTNDLDVETLELLESLLLDYAGTIILVSHDREFIDNVATGCLSFENDGNIREFVGGYSDVADWYKNADFVEQQRRQHINDVAKQKSSSKETSVKPTSNQVKPKTKVKLSYKESRELEQLPKSIEEYETEIEALQSQINAPDFFAKSNEETKPTLDRLANVESMLDEAFERWQLLEEKQNNAQ